MCLVCLQDEVCREVRCLCDMIWDMDTLVSVYGEDQIEWQMTLVSLNTCDLYLKIFNFFNMELRMCLRWGTQMFGFAGPPLKFRQILEWK